MSAELVYLAGPPGVGKSTLMQELTRRLEGTVVSDPFAHTYWTYPDGTLQAIELGWRRPTFAGTDTLSMRVQPAVVEWLGLQEYPLILGEGDRLANRNFLHAAAGRGYHITLVVLRAPQDVLDERRDERGSHQNGAWMKGRATKVERLHAYAQADGYRVIDLDTRTEPAALAADLANRLSPILGWWS